MATRFPITKVNIDSSSVNKQESRATATFSQAKKATVKSTFAEEQGSIAMTTLPTIPEAPVELSSTKEQEFSETVTHSQINIDSMSKAKETHV